MSNKIQVAPGLLRQGGGGPVSLMQLPTGLPRSLPRGAAAPPPSKTPTTAKSSGASSKKLLYAALAIAVIVLLGLVVYALLNVVMGSECHLKSGAVDDKECTCSPGYHESVSGDSCVDQDECAEGTHTCDHNCENEPGGFSCSCYHGYQFSKDTNSCEDANDCEHNNGGCSHICVDDIGYRNCSCYDGYSLSKDQRNCEDVDECGGEEGKCGHICTNTLGSYVCSCQPGYKLSSNKHSCATGTSGTCSLRGAWVDTTDCTCQEGFLPSQDGRSCEDIDECETENGHCDKYCHNNIGSYTCQCDPGFQVAENGWFCADLDECSIANGGCPGDCINEYGGHTCDCGIGYEWSHANSTCIDADECSAFNGGCEGSCFNSQGSYRCDCSDGWIPANDGSCVDFNECEYYNGGCSNGCENGEGNYTCTCDEGFTIADNQRQCEDMDECTMFPCAELCVNTDGSFICTSCDEGFELNDEMTECIAVCPDGWTMYDNPWRQCVRLFVNAAVHFEQARSICSAQGGENADVFEIRNAAANEWVRQNFVSSGTIFFLGIKEPAGSWIYQSDNQAITYSNWNPGEPNGATENCLEFYNTGYWNDGFCNMGSSRNILCSIDISA